jgi:uncharacterized protein YcaQ
MASVITLAHLRAHAVARTLFAPTTLPKAIARLGFVQADPIRAPARAQDLTLRHRVAGYRAGDLEARYPRLTVEEDFFVNYGFVPRKTHALMHPRSPRTTWTADRQAQADAVLDFVRERGVVHPREVDAAFAHGKARNWFGGSSNASTQLLDAMHYRGLLRIAKRESGVRLYALRPEQPVETPPADAMDALVDVVLAKYAPLPMASLGQLVSQLKSAVPQWAHLRTAALASARRRLPQASVDGVTWVWPAGEDPASRRHGLRASRDLVHLLAPFDPLVWDRRRFELLWGWAYRFEAYTPAPKRVRGYYALPLLWRDRVIGWGNLAVSQGSLRAEIGHVSGQAPSDPVFAKALEGELARIAEFLGLHDLAQQPPG